MWILPTFSRPAQCAAVLEQIQLMGCRSHGVVFVNGPEHAKEYEEKCSAIVQVLDWKLQINKENLGALGTLNTLFAAYPDEKFYGYIGDDEFVHTPGWDKILIDAAGDWGIAHGDDSLHHGGRAQGYLCIGGKLARAVGYLTIPKTWHWYGLDNMWEAISGELDNRTFCETVKIEHRHCYNQTAPRDACYELGESKAKEDEEVFVKWVHNEYRPAVTRVSRALIKDSRKK